MKKGYTLAELLITLGIIGILAAIMIPLTNKFRPDSTKVAYLNTYDSLVTVLNNIVNNEDIYPTISNGRNFTKKPLLNTASAEIDGTQISAGANKLCRILNETLKSEAKNIDINLNNACSDSPIAANLDATANFARDFTAKNGAQFQIGRVNQLYYETDIYVDIDGENGNNCIYDADTCPNPDRFKFFVGVNGKIVPADPMGKHYLETRTNLKAQKDVEIDDSEISFPEDMQKDGSLLVQDVSIEGIDLSELTEDELNTNLSEFIENNQIPLESVSLK